MKSKKLTVLLWVLCLTPALLTLLAWPRLPQQVPVQWGLNGTVRYGDKSTLWAMAALSAVMAPLFQFLPRLDPKRANYPRFQGVYTGVVLGIALFLTLITAILLVESLRPGTMNVARVVMAAVSVLLTVIGAVLGKVKPNWFMGIRTPWTLSDPDVWNRTHRLGGWLFFLSGLAGLVLDLLAPEAVMAAVFLALVLVSCVAPCVMSYVWFRAKQGRA